MCETIVFNAILKTVSDPLKRHPKPHISIERRSNHCRHLLPLSIFEKAVFEKRKESKLSADEIAASDAGRARKAYGDGRPGGS